MEIHINLLPQPNSRKEKRSIYLIPLLGMVLFVIAASFLVYRYFDVKSSVKELSEKITVQTIERNELITTNQELTMGVTEYNFTEKYRFLDEFLNSLYKDTVDVQERVYQLLPEGSKAKNYTYLNTGELTFIVDFYSKGESAIFLNRLMNADFVENAQMEKIAANDEDLTYEAIFQIKLNTFAGEEE